MGGKFHLKLNIGERPIANKYREGKMKSTLKRESKGPEIEHKETIETSDILVRIQSLYLYIDALSDHIGQHQFELQDNNCYKGS